MILLNEMEKNLGTLKLINLETFLKLLSPFAPHLSEELWQQLQTTMPTDRQANYKLQTFKNIHLESWPKYNSKFIVEKQFELIIQINGKIRDKISAEMGITQKEAENLALNQEKIKNAVADRKIRKIIFVPNKLINIVI